LAASITTPAVNAATRCGTDPYQPCTLSASLAVGFYCLRFAFAFTFTFTFTFAIELKME
jgi:hypothetical protein